MKKMPAKKKTKKRAVKKATTAKKKKAAKSVKKVKKAAKKKSVKSVKKGKRVKAAQSAKKVKRPASRFKKGLKTKTKATKKDKQEILRKLLVSHRNSIIKEAKEEIAKFIKGETRQLVDTALDDGDWSVVDISQDIDLRKLTAHKDTLNKVDEAIRKLNEGTYGICEDCGDEISEARLKVIPFAAHCLECKEQRERMEEFEIGEF